MTSGDPLTSLFDSYLTVLVAELACWCVEELIRLCQINSHMVLKQELTYIVWVRVTGGSASLSSMVSISLGTGRPFAANTTTP